MPKQKTQTVRRMPSFLLALFAFISLGLVCYVCIAPLLWRLRRLLGVLVFVPNSSQVNNLRPTVRIGILGAARINRAAILAPSLFMRDRVTITAIAARDRSRAEDLARGFNINKVYGDYQSVVDDPDVDAVYIPLPNGLHFVWAKRALLSGKHVLVEKPIASNADEVEELIKIAKQMDRLIMEATHSFHHPSLIRVRDLVRKGEIGLIKGLEAKFNVQISDRKDIRFNCGGTEPRLAGGATMDLGLYCIHAFRFVSDKSFSTVVDARAVTVFNNQVDESMHATLEDDDGVRATMDVSFNSGLFDLASVLKIHGTGGSIVVYNFHQPSLWNRIYVTRSGQTTRTESIYGTNGKSTYEHMLSEFVNQVAMHMRGQGGPVQSRVGGMLDDFLGVMRIIDDIYQAARMEKRVGFPDDSQILS